MPAKPLVEKDIAISFVRAQGKLLSVQRKDDNPLWDKKWEFPGGKLEDGESGLAAACRELFEETGITVETGKFFGVHDCDWDLADKILRVHMHCFGFELETRPEVVIEPRCAYGFAWVEPSELTNWNLLGGDAELIRKFFLS